MNTLVKFIIIPGMAFGALDWAADNPVKTKVLRNKVEKQFEKGCDLITKELSELSE